MSGIYYENKVMRPHNKLYSKGIDLDLEVLNNDYNTFFET